MVCNLEERIKSVGLLYGLNEHEANYLFEVCLNHYWDNSEIFSLYMGKRIKCGLDLRRYLALCYSNKGNMVDFRKKYKKFFLRFGGMRLALGYKPYEKRKYGKKLKKYILCTIGKKIRYRSGGYRVYKRYFGNSNKKDK